MHFFQTMFSIYQSFYFKPNYLIGQSSYSSISTVLDSNISLSEAIREDNLEAQCENVKLSKIYNIQNFVITEKLLFATEIVESHNVIGGCYSLDTLCKILTSLCKNATFSAKQSYSKYEGTIKIAKNDFLKKGVKKLSYTIPNRICYLLGLKTYSEICQEGMDTQFEIKLKKNNDGSFEPIVLDASLVKHMHNLEVTSNFIKKSDFSKKTEKHIASLNLTNDDLIKIFDDYLVLFPRNWTNNILSPNSIGNICNR